MIDVVAELAAICSDTNMASVDHRGIRRSREAIETGLDRIRSKLVISVEKRDEFG